MLLHQYVTWVSAGIWEILWIPGSRMVRQDMTGEDDMYSTLQEHLVSKGVPVII